MPARLVAVPISQNVGAVRMMGQRGFEITSRRGAMVGQSQSRINDAELIRGAQRGDRAAFE